MRSTICRPYKTMDEAEGNGEGVKVVTMSFLEACENYRKCLHEFQDDEESVEQAKSALSVTEGRLERSKIRFQNASRDLRQAANGREVAGV